MQSSSSSSYTNGQVVSLTYTGELQVGAGTSVYKNIADLSIKCPAYLTMSAVYNNTYLVSYADKTTSQSTLQVITMDAVTPNVGTVVNTIDNVPYYIYEIVTLNSITGVFVGICQDTSSTDETAYVIAGRVDYDSHDISLQSSIQTYTDVYSINPAITRLSDTSFAIAYFDYGSNKLITSYGNALDVYISASLYIFIIFLITFHYIYILL